MKVLIKVGDVAVEAKLHESTNARMLYAALPLRSVARRWGDEIYFELPLKLKPEKLTLDVSVGDVAYWPSGNCLCIFFGPTPISNADRPKPASSIELIGKIDRAEVLRLKKACDGDIVMIEKC